MFLSHNSAVTTTAVQFSRTQWRQTDFTPSLNFALSFKKLPKEPMEQRTDLVLVQALEKNIMQGWTAAPTWSLSEVKSFSCDSLQYLSGFVISSQYWICSWSKVLMIKRELHGSTSVSSQGFTRRIRMWAPNRWWWVFYHLLAREILNQVALMHLFKNLNICSTFTSQKWWIWPFFLKWSGFYFYKETYWNMNLNKWLKARVFKIKTVSQSLTHPLGFSFQCNLILQLQALTKPYLWIALLLPL